MRELCTSRPAKSKCPCAIQSMIILEYPNTLMVEGLQAPVIFKIVIPTGVKSRVDSDQSEQNGEDYVIDNKLKVFLLLASDRETTSENAWD